MSNDQANWYGNVFKSWNVKALGPKPTAEMLASIHGLQARPGKQALACAMALRDCGVTAGQIVIACGAPQLNKMRGFITDALLKRLPVAPSAEGHTVYKLELTAKGKQRVDRTAKAAEAKAAAGEAETADKPKGKKAATKAAGKPKGTAKRKPKAEPAAVETVASEADTVTETVEHDGLRDSAGNLLDGGPDVHA
jgi:hypothetical protein